ncbi:MAG: peptidase associated/transthyretin-like domain-containing protein [Planctomycetota bacterium]|jgi:hypothetical protein
MKQTTRLLIAIVCVTWIASPARAQETKQGVRQRPGRIDGVAVFGGKPRPGMKVRLVLPTDDPDASERRSTTTDAKGRFVFDDVRPGRALLNPEVLRFDDGSTGGLLGLRTEVQVGLGAATEVTLGGLGRPVVGRAVLPPDLGRDAAWNLARARMHVTAPASSGITRLVTKIAKAFGRFLTSDIGKAYKREGILLRVDGSFRIEGVPSGTFFVQIILPAFAYDPRDPETGAPKLQTIQRFNVPPMPGGRSDEPLSLGDLDKFRPTPDSRKRT